MAHLEFDDVEGGEGYGYGTYDAPPSVSAVQRLINVAGALTTVAVVIGVGVWGYKIAVRDANGIPVVRALEGPMRVAPVQPGGSIADHQGLSINQIAAVGAAAPLPEQIVLAPVPTGLTPEDAAGLAPPPTPADTAAPTLTADPEATVLAALAAPADSDPVADALVAAMAPAAPTGDAGADVLSLADMLAAGATPLSALSGDDQAADPVDTAALVPGAEFQEAVAEGGVARSLRPLARPAALQADVARASGDPVAAAVADAVAGALAVAVAEVDPASLKAGDRLVQLGAFDDMETARAEWDRLAGRFGELMSSKGRVIQSAQSGGRTFYRLRAHGFEDEADARRFCSALLAEDAACIPVAIR